MSTLIEELPGDIARLEAKYGPDNQFVKDLKEQLRASKATQGKTAQEVYRMQAAPLPSRTSSEGMTEDELEIRAGKQMMMARKHQNEQLLKKD